MDCWSQIRTLQGKTLRTLDQRKPFTVVDILDSQVALKVSTGKIRPVRRDEIEGPFRELVREGEITRTRIQAQYSARNPAYVAAILAELDGVTCRDKPIRLFYRPEKAVTEISKEVPAVHTHKELSARSVTILKLIAQGHTYDQILALHPELTYPDIFEAAREALER
ncbi:MAG: hypothetical protein JXM73_24115 [Anaerolineae bacterium]|nr:hypothetical protein [Anaerolineae bacterium]